MINKVAFGKYLLVLLIFKLLKNVSISESILLHKWAISFEIEALKGFESRII